MTWFAFATASALLSAAAALLQKKVLFRLTPLEFSFILSAVILLFSLFVPVTTDTFSVPAASMVILLLKSVLGGIAFLCVMHALQKNQISSALPLLGITPAAAALLSLPVLGESLRPWEWIGVGLMMAGSYTLELRPNQSLLRPFRHIASTRSYYYIYAAVALFAVSSVADRLLLSGYRIAPPVVLFYQHVVYCAIFGAQLLLRRRSLRAVFSGGKEYLVPIACIALITLAYRYTQLEATRLASVALVLAVKRTSILYATVAGGLLFKDERITIKTVAGILIVASGFIILREIG